MNVATWLLIAYIGLSLSLCLFAPLRVKRDPETMVDRGFSILAGIVLLFYLFNQLG